jgi:DNA-binding transcriptional MocR family regulator
MVSVQQTSAGPELNQLESIFASKKIKLFYAVPDFHNPTGICWSLETRQQVAVLCQEYGVTLVEDVPYRDLRFNGKALPLVSSFCSEQAIVLRSFSKISAPGIRLGLVCGPENYLQPMIKVKQASDLHTALPMQAALLQVLQDPAFTSHLEQVRSAYKLRYLEFKESLSRLMEQGCSFDNIQGGMFIWLRLPEVDAMDLAKQLLKNKVAVVPSNVFYQHEEEIQPALRLNFTYCSPAELKIAVLKLEQALISQVVTEA